MKEQEIKQVPEKETSTFVQTKGVYDKTKLEDGIEFDIRTDAKKIIGVNLINTAQNQALYDEATFEVRIGRGVYIWEGTPVTLAQANQSVEPDKRFLTLFGKLKLTDYKCYIKVLQPNTNADLVINLLLEK